MSVTVSIAVSPALMGASTAWYLTIAQLDGPVLYEGDVDDLGILDAVVMVPCGTRAIKVLLESSRTYKDAVVQVRDDGTAEHTFA